MFNFGKKYHQLNSIEISQAALLHNYSYLISKGIAVAPVLKSNAYGHGLTLVAKILDGVNAPFFCVDSLYEAYELLKIGIKTSILIMGYTHPDNLKVKKLPFSFAVYDKETVSVLNKYQSHAGIHIFVDTGMNREGIKLAELPEFLDYINTFNDIKIEGLMSHFAASDQYNNPLTKEQVKNFQVAQKMLQQAKIYPKWLHIGNSSAVLHQNKYRKKLGNLVRPGIDLFGIDPEGKDSKLKPALCVLTTLCQVKSLRKGEKIGYDFTFTAKKDMTIGILPYGYYDGMDRRLSNKGVVLINKIMCPIVGRISMNITTIDVSKVSNPHVGQNVVIYSNKISDNNCVYKSAIYAGTIPYDLLIHLASSTKRIVVK